MALVPVVVVGVVTLVVILLLSRSTTCCSTVVGVLLWLAVGGLFLFSTYGQLLPLLHGERWL